MLMRAFRLLLVMGFGFFTAAVVAGEADERQPKSWGHAVPPLKSTAILHLPSINREALTRKYDREDQKKNVKGSKWSRPYTFAEPYDVELQPTVAGQWDNRGSMAVWRIHLQGDQALGINLGLSDVYLPEGAALYLYSENKQQLVGPYTDSDNKNHGQLWTPVVTGSSLILELNVPQTLKSQVRFTLKRISQSFRDMKQTFTGGKSGACNIDVACSQGDNWRDQIRSAGLFTIVGVTTCSGTLINNANNDLAPYFLTADHCNVTIATAPSMVFYWNYQTSTCRDRSVDNTVGTRPTAGNTGATFVAGRGGLGEFDNGSDFTLVLLDAMPPVSANVFWSGWDNQNMAFTSVVGIHHPNGDEKSISLDTGSLTITDYFSTTEDSSMHFLRVGEWDEGTTEPGSSGSGLWNSDKRLIGTLSGGNASCTALAESDWYGRLSSHWDTSIIRINQLKHWLNPPSTTRLQTLDGRNGCDFPLVTMTAPAQTQVGQSENYSASVSGGTGPYIYSWDFDDDGVEDSASAAPSYAYSAPMAANVRLVVIDSVSCPVRKTAEVNVIDSNERFGGAGTFPQNFSTGNGNNAWVIDRSTAHEGIFSLKSGAITHRGTTDLVLTADFAAGPVSFARKVSSEGGYDYLQFLVDGTQQAQWAGDHDWETFTFTLAAGNHTLTWRYNKDDSASVAADAVWVDDIQYTLNTSPPPPSPTQDDNDSNSTNWLWLLLLLEASTLDFSGSSDEEGGGGSIDWLWLAVMVYGVCRRRYSITTD